MTSSPVCVLGRGRQREPYLGVELEGGREQQPLERHGVPRQLGEEAEELRTEAGGAACTEYSTGSPQNSTSDGGFRIHGAPRRFRRVPSTFSFAPVAGAVNPRTRSRSGSAPPPPPSAASTSTASAASATSDVGVGAVWAASRAARSCCTRRA